MTKTIEFDDIQVGDKIRASRTEVQSKPNGSVSTYVTTHELTVGSIDVLHRRVRDGHQLSVPASITSTVYTFELLERKVSEPEGVGAVVTFVNEVGLSRTYVRVSTPDWESLHWYSPSHGFESWSRVISRATIGTLTVISEGVEL